MPPRPTNQPATTDDLGPASSREPAAPSPWILSRNHQTIVAVASFFGFLALTIYFCWLANRTRRLVDIEQTTKYPYRFQVDLNKADWVELAAIPGIGKTLAQRIVQHREQHGDFRDVDGIVQVPGIGHKSLQKFRPFLYCGSPPASQAFSKRQR